MLVRVRDFCLQILESGELAAKLAPPPALTSFEPFPPVRIDRPVRGPALAMRGRVAPLPRPHELADADARALCLARFAHHELMAVELFAWALLRWPELPEAMRRGMLAILTEEQRHCRLYLARLRAHGSDLADHALSDYFWKHAPAIAASAAGPAAFLAAMGLTLEQANLDFAPLYRDAFRRAGDERSARVCELVHRDEIGHVGFAAHWLRALAGGAAEADGPSSADDIALYTRAVPFPLCAARAKGRRFDASARARAGLSQEFIDHVRSARSPQELRGAAAPSRGEG
jgi:uncharacterized ferritin-like protein (DUF455 family)